MIQRLEDYTEKRGGRLVTATRNNTDSMKINWNKKTTTKKKKKKTTKAQSEYKTRHDYGEEGGLLKIVKKKVLFDPKQKVYAQPRIQPGK